jgi:hypothetical protein
LESAAEKSGAALPIGGESTAKSAVAMNELMMIRIDFVFIDY